MTEKQIISLRAHAIYGLFLIALIWVLVKTFMIQAKQDDGKYLLRDKKTGKYISARDVFKMPRMGQILDCNGTALVTSVSTYNIYMDPTAPDDEVFNKEVSDLCEKLALIFPQKSAREYENYLRRGRARKNKYLLLKKKATNEQRKYLHQLPIFKLGRNKGGLIDSEENIQRKRPFGELMKRTLGYYSPIKVGIEGAYYDYLAGEPGIEVEQRIATGWKKTGKIIKEAVVGADIVTSIDKEIQEVAHSELYKQLRSQKARNGCVIVMDVRTGFVKAIVNLSKADDGNYYELYNQAIGTKEVPGSTFKLASLMAGLEDDKFKITDTVQGASSYTFFGKTLTEAKKHNYGRISIQQAFEKSSNVISKIIYKAYKDEPQEFIRHLDEFGLTEPLGIELAGEAAPIVSRPGTKRWSRLSLPWMAVGYEFQQTPLQTLAFYNAVANDGKMVKPQFVKEIRRGAEVVKTFSPVVLRQKICSISTLETLQNCMVGVMKNGTGKKLTSSYFEIAGKTGTAQIMNDKSAGETERVFLASFVGYFPVRNPLYSCIVSVEAVGENVYGSVMSGTVFSAIANKVYASRLKYHKAINEKGKRKFDLPSTKDGNRYDLKNVLKDLHIPYIQNTEEEWVGTTRNKSSIEFHKRLISRGLVPDVIGMTAKDAVYLIENSGMNVRLIGAGKIVKQSVKPGSQVYRGGLIELTLR
ncbi:MAG: penicillin-binding transpeptidase domain-containing protein [Crocinitomicaceae bacterium]